MGLQGCVRVTIEQMKARMAAKAVLVHLLPLLLLLPLPSVMRLCLCCAYAASAVLNPPLLPLLALMVPL